MEDVMQDKSLGRGKPCSPVKQASFLNGLNLTDSHHVTNSVTTFTLVIASYHDSSPLESFRAAISPSQLGNRMYFFD